MIVGIFRILLVIGSQKPSVYVLTKSIGFSRLSSCALALERTGIRPSIIWYRPWRRPGAQESGRPLKVPSKWALYLEMALMSPVRNRGPVRRFCPGRRFRPLTVVSSIKYALYRVMKSCFIEYIRVWDYSVAVKCRMFVYII